MKIHIKIYNPIDNKILKNIYLIKKFRLSILQCNQKIQKSSLSNIDNLIKKSKNQVYQYIQLI